MVLRPTGITPPDSAPLTPAGFMRWLEAHGLDQLRDPLLAADARDTWAQDGPHSAFFADVIRLYEVLVAASASPSSADPLASAVSRDLTLVLAYLRTSRSLQVLAAFNRRFPGHAERLLVTDAASPEAAVVVQRLRYLVRQQCFHELFSPARRADVMAAVAAATH